MNVTGYKRFYKGSLELETTEGTKLLLKGHGAYVIPHQCTMWIAAM